MGSANSTPRGHPCRGSRSMAWPSYSASCHSHSSSGVSSYQNSCFYKRLKQPRLEADRTAAEHVGGEVFHEVLAKIDGLGQPDIEKLKEVGLKARMSGRPTISEGVANLQD